MKKLLSIVLTLVMLASVVPVWADVPEVAVPASWEVIAEATFTNEGVEDVNGDEVVDILDFTTTGITGWTNSYSDTDRTDTVLSSSGLYIGARNDASNAVIGALEKPIDLAVDADYYIIYTTNFNGGGKQQAACSLKRELIYEHPNNGNPRNERKLDYFHFSASDDGSGKQLWTGYKYQAKNPETGGDYAWGGTTKQAVQNTGTTVKSNVVQTVVGQLSIRNGNATQRIRLFTADEVPTFSPDYWDVVTFNSPTWRDGDTADKKFDKIEFQYNGNSGHVTGPTIQGFKLYKAPAVNAYTLSDNNSNSNMVPYVGCTVTVQADTTLTQSIVWYDITGDAPVELATGAAYTIPASMCGRKIKAIVTTTAGEEYEAVTGTVHGTNEINALSAKITATSEFDANDFSTYANATSIAFNGTVRKVGTTNVYKTYALITAQYSKDGMLKSIQTSQADNRLGDIWPGSTKATSTSGWVQNVFTFDHENMNYAPGDYFNCYIWMSESSTTGTFKYDSITPLPVNGEMITPISHTVFTIPEA